MIDNALGWALVAAMFSLAFLALSGALVIFVDVLDGGLGDHPAECQARKDAGVLSAK